MDKQVRTVRGARNKVGGWARGSSCLLRREKYTHTRRPLLKG